MQIFIILHLLITPCVVKSALIRLLTEGLGQKINSNKSLSLTLYTHTNNNMVLPYLLIVQINYLASLHIQAARTIIPIKCRLIVQKYFKVKFPQGVPILVLIDVLCQNVKPAKSWHYRNFSNSFRKFRYYDIQIMIITMIMSSQMNSSTKLSLSKMSSFVRMVRFNICTANQS